MGSKHIKIFKFKNVGSKHKKKLDSKIYKEFREIKICQFFKFEFKNYKNFWGLMGNMGNVVYILKLENMKEIERNKLAFCFCILLTNKIVEFIINEWWQLYFPFLLHTSIVKLLTCHHENLDLSFWKPRPSTIKISTYYHENNIS